MFLRDAIIGVEETDPRVVAVNLVLDTGGKVMLNGYTMSQVKFTLDEFDERRLNAIQDDTDTN